MAKRKNADKVDGLTLQQYIKFDTSYKNFNNYIVFDLETTGLNYQYDKIIQIGAVKMKNDQTVDTYSQYVNPECKLTQRIVNLTGIDQDLLDDSPTIEEVLPKFLEFVGEEKVLVAHNATFDARFLLYNMFKLKMSKPKYVFIDTLQFADNYITDTDGMKLKSYNLDSLKKALNLKEYKSHNALDDSMATAAIYIKCKEYARNRVKELYPKLQYLQYLREKRKELLIKLVFSIKSIPKHK